VITLRIGQSRPMAVEAEVITPDGFAGRTLAEIERLPVVQGNAEARLGDFVAVSGSVDEAIRLEGDFSSVRGIGRAMTHGRIEAQGDVGMGLGAEMRDGEVVVRGSAGDWAGAEMRGGLLRIEGNAGNLVGAAYRGSEKGMRGGAILVAGSVGGESGSSMRRGLIVVGAGAGDLTGARMIAGSIFVFGELGAGTGTGMKRGTVVAYRGAGQAGAGSGVALLPTFRYDCAYRPAWIGVYLRQLSSWGVRLPDGIGDGVYHRYSGDLTELGKGEILAWTAR
jgi:formylmethanofuran dehydrogenase subunit C